MPSSSHSEAAAGPARPSPLAARRSVFHRLATERFDLLVVGGGINGAGIARDAALRGLAVALVERDDFASGTSSRSSRLIHGGIRYLEHGYLHLVFEASRERRTLLRVAPHLVHPLEFTWPVYAGARVPGWKLRAGLLLYDALSLFRNVANHTGLSAAEVLEREPALRHDRLRSGAAYYDAATDDSRLTLANALAAAEAGAAVANHAAVRALVRDHAGDGARVSGAVVEDTGTGERIEVRARVVVNATGPWADVLRQQEDAAAPPAVRGTKGAHILVPRARLGNRGALTLLSPLDGRVMFALPAGAYALVGTTDTPTRATPDDVRATEADVDYLLRSANAFFPEAALTRADVLSAWAGIRPLVAAGYRANGGAASASREHAIDRGAGGVLAVSGGKLTTYRSMSAEVVDAAGLALDRQLRPASTAIIPLPGGDVASFDAERSAARARVAREDVADRLVAAFGTRWREVWCLAEAEPALATPVAPGLPYVGAELAYAVDREMACTLADLLVRRTRLAFETGDAGASVAARVAAIVAPRLAWDEARLNAEVDRYCRDASRLFGVDAAEP